MLTSPSLWKWKGCVNIRRLQYLQLGITNWRCQHRFCSKSTTCDYKNMISQRHNGTISSTKDAICALWLNLKWLWQNFNIETDELYTGAAKRSLTLSDSGSMSGHHQNSYIEFRKAVPEVWCLFTLCLGLLLDAILFTAWKSKFNKPPWVSTCHLR